MHKTSAGSPFTNASKGLYCIFYNIIYQGNMKQVCIICLKSDCTIDWLVHYWSDELQAENDEKIQAPASVVRGRLYYIHCGVSGSKSSGNYQYWHLQYIVNFFESTSLKIFVAKWKEFKNDKKGWRLGLIHPSQVFFSGLGQRRLLQLFWNIDFCQYSFWIHCMKTIPNLVFFKGYLVGTPKGTRTN